MDFLDKLNDLMKKNNLNKNALSKACDIPYTTIDGWYKRGYEALQLPTVRKLAAFFNTSLDYWAKDEITDVNYGKTNGFDIEYAEMEHIKKYRDLDNHGRRIIDLLLKEEYERCKGVNNPKEPYQPFRIINYYQRLASAGTGQIVFDDIPTEMIQIPDVAKYKRVKYAIGVDGDSMYPDYCDGDVLLVEPTREIEIDEVGIFMVDGMAYVKKLGNKELISINPDYKNVPLTENTACLGRVIDKLEGAELELDYPESDISELPSDSMRAIENDMRAHKKQDA